MSAKVGSPGSCPPACLTSSYGLALHLEHIFGGGVQGAGEQVQKIAPGTPILTGEMASLIKGPGLSSAIHGVVQRSRILLRVRGPFSTSLWWAAPKRGDLELLSMEVAAAGSVGGVLPGRAAGGSMHGGRRANLYRGRVDGPHSHSFRSKRAQRQGQGARMGRLSEPMKASEDTTNETMEGGVE
eukprot:1159265-Pelagomonas_calceolata.AAC.3